MSIEPTTVAYSQMLVPPRHDFLNIYRLYNFFIISQSTQKAGKQFLRSLFYSET